MNQKVLLIGNDKNSISKGHYSWDDLLVELVDFVHASGKIEIDRAKPFPLLYEEINLEAQRNQARTESEIKSKVAETIKKLIHNEIHQEIIQLGITDILTTNYDLTLESALQSNTKKLTNKGIIKEFTFSLFRKYEIDKTNFWHIHGDQNYSNSIILGFGRYGDYLQKMRDYIVTGTRDNYKDFRFAPLSKRLKNHELTGESWVDFFFTKDVFILGLSLDFVEIHLWWLLTTRARFKQDKDIQLNNKIYYFYPKQLEKTIIHKLQILKVYGVNVISFDKPNKKATLPYYQKIIKKIKAVS